MILWLKDPDPFEQVLLSIFENNEIGFPRRTNHVEAWHERWDYSINRAQNGLYNINNHNKDEEQSVGALIERILAGDPGPPEKRSGRLRKQRLETVIEN